MCYMCEIKSLKKEKHIEEAESLILEFKQTALQMFGEKRRDEIVKRLWH